MISERALTEKQRVSLPIPLWLSLAGIIITGAGAWFATSARASAAAEGVTELRNETRSHDRRIQHTEDELTFLKQMLGQMNEKLDRALERK